MQAPTKRDPLAPASNDQLNLTLAVPPTRKRKRTDGNDQKNNLVMFSVSAVDSDTEPRSAIFTAIVTLSRADLPLTWIDQTVTSSELPAGYTFRTSHTPLRQLRNKYAMLARLTPNGRLYALEQVQNGVFAAVRLHNWVTEEAARSAVNGESERPELPPLNVSDREHSRHHSRAGSTSSARSLRLPTPTSPRKPTNRKGAMARASILRSRERSQGSPAVESFGGNVTESPQEVERSAGETPLPPELPTLLDAGPSMTSESRNDNDRPEADQGSTIAPENLQFELGTIENLRIQYLETLYLSRTSLAFYAKGPLARARGQLKDAESLITSAELKELYDSGILTPKKMDKKYKESIPELLKESTTPAAEVKKRKRKTAKTLKLGKNCLYTGEDELVKKWWDQRHASNGDESHEAEIKKRVAELRIRETEMQVLLILEALILDQASHDSTSAPAELSEPAVKIEPPADVEIPKPQETKKTKPRNYVHELETLLERLCIWHAVKLDDFEESPGKSWMEGGGSKDRLKDFCTDVIIPFYASKIPAYVKIACKKLGGPSISPQRPRLPRPQSSSRAPDRSGKTKNKPSTKTSLRRVLSEDQDLRHGSPPVLSRSLSDQRRSGIKRESSEVISRPPSRAGMQRSVSFSNREVDLEADARTQEAKRRKLEKVTAHKKELDAAIAALKKPNRTSAAKEMMDEAERRAAAKNAVQITATPRKGRGQIAAMGSSLYQPAVPAPEPDPVIPSSTIKPSSLGVSRSSVKKRAVLDAIHDTPSRGEGKTSDPLDLGVGQPGGPLVAATPAMKRLRPDLPTETPLQSKMTKSGRSVLFTPVKRGDVAVEDVFRDAPEIPEKAGKAMDRVMGGRGIGDPLFSDSGIGSSGGRSKNKEEDLYAQLGWNDDDFGDL